MKKNLFLSLFLIFSIFSLSAESNMILVPAGNFVMGSPETEKMRNTDENPHEVYISSFFVDAYEVQQCDYELVMGENPSSNIGENLPVENVTYYDAIKYCNKKSRLEKLKPCYMIEGKNISWDKSANGYRLLTEAEWEYVCRAGGSTVFTNDNWTSAWEYNYDCQYPYQIEENYSRNTNRNVQVGRAKGRTVAVNSMIPNALGLYHVNGNVREWVFDFYGPYEKRSVANPWGARSGIYRICRGGGYTDSGKDLRCAYREPLNPKTKSSNLGFRIARNADGNSGWAETKNNEEIEKISVPVEPKILIVYFSVTGNVKAAAELIDKKLAKAYGRENVDCIQLEVFNPYTGDVYEESQRDLLSGTIPKLKTKIKEFEKYDVVMIGYPIWWSTYPMCVEAFISSYDLKGKIVLPFASHGGSLFGQSLGDFARRLPSSYLGLGLEFKYGGGMDFEDKIDEWLLQELNVK